MEFWTWGKESVADEVRFGHSTNLELFQTGSRGSANAEGPTGGCPGILNSTCQWQERQDGRWLVKIKERVSSGRLSSNLRSRTSSLKAPNDEGKMRDLRVRTKSYLTRFDDCNVGKYYLATRNKVL